METKRQLDDKIIKQLVLAIYNELSLTGHPLATQYDIDWAYHNLQRLNIQGSVVGLYENDELMGVFAYSIDLPWFSEKPILDEMIVLKIHPLAKGVQREAIKEMKRIAKEQGITVKHAGNLLSIDKKLTANGYTKNGYNYEYQCFLEVDKDE